MRFIVPISWMVDVKNKMPFLTFVYYNKENYESKVPTKSFLKTLIDFDFNNKIDNFVYKAKVLNGFGKSYSLNMLLHRNYMK
jgi:hypothetical protein